VRSRFFRDPTMGKGWGKCIDVGFGDHWTSN
jgi:hypothetical protein